MRGREYGVLVLMVQMFRPPFCASDAGGYQSIRKKQYKRDAVTSSSSSRPFEAPDDRASVFDSRDLSAETEIRKENFVSIMPLASRTILAFECKLPCGLMHSIPDLLEYGSALPDLFNERCPEK